MNDEMKNRFQKHNDLKSARHLKTAESAEAREDRRQAQRESWVSANRSGRAGVGVAGTVLDPKTVAAKAAMEADKAARQQDQAAKATPISLLLNPADTEAIFEGFLRQCTDFYDTQFNRQNLFNCVLANLRKLTGFNIDSLNRCYAWLRDNNYFERPRQHRGLNNAGRAALVYAYEPEKDAPVEVPAQNVRTTYSTEIAREEYQRLNRMDFATLAAKARSSFKADRRD